MSAAALSSSGASSSPTTTTRRASMQKLRFGSAPTLWLLSLWLALLVVMAQQQACECRYLPTRSHGDDLDKLRELMLQILESSNEDAQRSPNDGNNNNLAQRAAWLNKLNAIDADGSRKFGRNPYETGRYY